jgi:hypothetical protein
VCKASLILFLFLFGCTSTERHHNLEKDLIGEWYNIYLRVTLNGGVRNDSEKVMECDSANWEIVLQMKPIHTFFRDDGSYRSEYHTLDDSIFQTTSGTWKFSNDTLVMDQLKPSPASYKLKTSIQKGVAEFEGFLDFDQDGKNDDHYFGIQRKQF